MSSELFTHQDHEMSAEAENLAGVLKLAERVGKPNPFVWRPAPQGRGLVAVQPALSKTGASVRTYPFFGLSSFSLPSQSYQAYPTSSAFTFILRTPESLLISNCSHCISCALWSSKTITKWTHSNNTNHVAPKCRTFPLASFLGLEVHCDSL
jgi:hypothetical protein